jgi:hypothetical protein
MTTSAVKKLGAKETQLQRIRRAYDQTVDRFFAGIEDEELLPEEFRKSERDIRSSGRS